MTLKELSAVFIFIFIGYVGNTQENVRGIVLDKVSGDPVYGVVVKLDSVGKTRTDFDGSFSLKLPTGTYILTFSNTVDGYIDEKREISVVDGVVLNFTVDLGKTPEMNLADVIVSVVIGGPSVEGTDKERLEGTGATDKIGSEVIQRSGVSDAAAAVGKTPGASVEDGKNIYIRGLGDRYTKTIFNGMDLPGLDPDRNSVQLDIFPAIIIDNITVYKTFTPNLTADFTGGLVDIVTKDFPARKTLYVKAGLGYNTNASFNPDFISYQGGKIDFLGFDDGSRSLPIYPGTTIPHPASGLESTEAATRAFGNVMATEKTFSFLNQNYAFACGDQKKFKIKKDSTKKLTYGYNVVLNYRSSNTYFADVQYNEYLRDSDLTRTELFRDRTSSGEQTQTNVLWTALFGQSIKVKRSKLSLVLFHTQNGTSSAANLVESNFDSNQAVLAKQGLQYTQRSVSNVNLSGTHYLDSSANWKLSWKLSPTYSKISDPDIRSTALEISDTPGPAGEVQYLMNEAVGSEVRRIFRSLTEYNVSGRFDLDYSFKQWDSLKSVLSFGGLTTYKSRDFEVSEYVFRLYGMSNVVPNDPDWFFQSENIYSTGSGQGVYATGQQEKANNYSANQMTNAVYVMNELPLSKSISSTYGARLERNVNRYTGQSSNAEFDTLEPRYVNEIVLNKINVLPSINLVYKIRKAEDSLKLKRNTNIRAAYTQTVARPSFREISISQIYDPIQGRRYLGNINLKQTLIHNADLRWERFFGRTELISASMFYKKFINPIEIVANVAAPNEFIPVNAGEADIYGAEFEFRKSIGFKKEDKSHIKFVLGANFTYVQSRIDMNKVETQVGGVILTEKEVRVANARVGEVIGDYRSMYGQSPYIVNAFANFSNDSLNLVLNVSYNVQGKKLAVIGIGSLPDVYEQPFHNLSLKVSKGLGKIHTEKNETEPRWNVSLTGRNLLNVARRRYYESYNAESQIFDYLHQGVTVTGSISYTIR